MQKSGVNPIPGPAPQYATPLSEKKFVPEASTLLHLIVFLILTF